MGGTSQEICPIDESGRWDSKVHHLPTNGGSAEISGNIPCYWVDRYAAYSWAGSNIASSGIEGYAGGECRCNVDQRRAWVVQGP